MVKKFSIPGYYEKYGYILDILAYRQAHLDWFYPDRIIDSCYGAHPDILWTGGRKIWNAEPTTSMNTILEGFSAFPSVELRHICTNYFITPEILTDYKTNYFMQHYLREQDKLVVANDSLIKYIQEKYPKNDFIYSTTMNITDISRINNMTKDHIYVLNYNYNNQNDYIKRLKHPENIEILCAEPCTPNCPNRVKHYAFISKYVLGQVPQDQEFPCINKGKYDLRLDFMKLSTAVTSERVDELSEMGINYFKISGRKMHIPNWLDTITYYLVLPEYKEYVFTELLSSWW